MARKEAIMVLERWHYYKLSGCILQGDDNERASMEWSQPFHTVTRDAGITHEEYDRGGLNCSKRSRCRLSELGR